MGSRPKQSEASRAAALVQETPAAALSNAKAAERLQVEREDGGAPVNITFVLPPQTERATPAIAVRAGQAVETCGNAAAVACEELAQSVQADAERIMKFLHELAIDFRRRGSLAAKSVEQFGADTEFAFSKLSDLRVELDAREKQA
jgi:hypothetical protein